MDGNVAPMDRICALAEKYDALVMVDESHSAGVVGPTGHGVSEQYATYGKVDIVHRHTGQSLWWCIGRIHNRTQRNHRPVAPTQPSVSIL